MNQVLVFAVLFTGMAMASLGGQAPPTLVRNGQATSIIVTAEKPSAAAREAARDLQMWLEKVSGVTLTIQTENRLPPATQLTRVLVGDSLAVRQYGVDASKLDLEEIRIQTFPDALVILGDDERPDGVPLRGTAWAVDTFAEQQLGVRVLWPGDLGLVVPKKSTIVINALDYRCRARSAQAQHPQQPLR